jgi:hypothetical protein
MSATSVMLQGRARAEALMQDTCVIRRRSGETTDENTGEVTPTYTQLYNGRCRVQQRVANASPAEAGEAYALMLALEVQLPMSVTGLRTEDEIVITESLDPDLVDRVFVIRALAHKTHATARRVGVVERTS